MTRDTHPKMCWIAVLLACSLWSVALSVVRPAPPPAQHAVHTEFPTHWEGKPLRPLALSEVEQRFAQHFPGTLDRLTDGERVLVLRTVQRPTRMLHPATDCYRGLGFSISAEQLEHDRAQRTWRCFEAERQGQRLRVCERITDAHGQSFTDTSAWYWNATLNQSTGPWQAITVASPL